MYENVISIIWKNPYLGWNMHLDLCDFRHAWNYRQDVFCEKVFLEISQNSLENTGARVSILIKLLGSGTSVFLWKLRNF